MKVCLGCEKKFSTEGWICPACGYAPAQLNKIDAHAPEFSSGGGGFKSEYFSELARLEGLNFWFQARNELILWALGRFKPKAKNFLEVGCGTGFVLSGIAELNPSMSLSGSEIFLAGLSHAVERVPRAKFIQMDARQVPFVDEFDAIGAFDVLEHINEDTIVLAQLHKALRPKGVLLLTVPQHPNLWSAADEYACHLRRYTCPEIEGKVRDAGFEILKSTSFVTLLFPLMKLSRVLQNKDKKVFNPTDELKINPLLNKIFYFLMILEFAGIKLGVNYPFGGSRMIVARK
jgi:SAM-dependent methyltransferase